MNWRHEPNLWTRELVTHHIQYVGIIFVEDKGWFNILFDTNGLIYYEENSVYFTRCRAL